MVDRPDADEVNLHATCIAVGRHAALLRGPSGAGKSDLALRCIATPPSPLWPAPVTFVADDRVILRQVDGRLIARPPPPLRGLLEVRGVGIVRLPFVEGIEISLAIDLVKQCEVSRLPDPWPTVTLLGVEIRLLQLDPFEPSAPLKVLSAMATSTVA